jgi:hypothetical protein
MDGITFVNKGELLAYMLWKTHFSGLWGLDETYGDWIITSDVHGKKIVSVYRLLSKN